LIIIWICFSYTYLFTLFPYFFLGPTVNTVTEVMHRMGLESALKLYEMKIPPSLKNFRKSVDVELWRSRGG